MYVYMKKNKRACMYASNEYMLAADACMYAFNKYMLAADACIYAWNEYTLVAVCNNYNSERP
jgi:hypothetical protein